MQRVPEEQRPKLLRLSGFGGDTARIVRVTRLREGIHPEGPGPAPRVGLCGPRQGQQGQVMLEEQR